MGLDMYLSAERYVSGWDHENAEEKEKFSKVLEIVEGQQVPTDDCPSLTVSVNCAYWRKANAIHRWFVENVQDGQDDCKSYYVSREQLQELKALCEKVLSELETQEGDICTGVTYQSGKPPLKSWKEGTVVSNKSVAKKHLPTQDGFFFGGTDYDEGYITDLRDTVEQLERVLKIVDRRWSFHYQSSW